jgi:nucleoside-diphosphate kinase
MSERTLIIIKPDGVQRRLTGEVISRFERKGLKLVAAKLMWLGREQAEKHYAVHRGKAFFPRVVEYLASGPVLVMVWEAEQVIGMCRELIGKTFGSISPAGTIRGDFSCSTEGINLIHGSDSRQSAEYEIGLYFKPEELFTYTFTDQRWITGQGYVPTESGPSLGETVWVNKFKM